MGARIGVVRVHILILRGKVRPVGSARLKRSAAACDYDPAKCSGCGERLRSEIHMVGAAEDGPTFYCTPCYERQFPEMGDWRRRMKWDRCDD